VSERNGKREGQDIPQPKPLTSRKTTTEAWSLKPGMRWIKNGIQENKEEIVDATPKLTAQN